MFSDVYSDDHLVGCFEDIVSVLENRAAIWQGMSNAGFNLKKYLLEEFRTLYKHRIPENGWMRTLRLTLPGAATLFSRI